MSRSSSTTSTRALVPWLSPAGRSGIDSFREISRVSVSSPGTPGSTAAFLRWPAFYRIVTGLWPARAARRRWSGGDQEERMTALLVRMIARDERLLHALVLR